MPIRHTLYIIVPFYNPDPGWEILICDRFDELVKALPEVDIKFALVNDGSTSGYNEKIADTLKSSIPALTLTGYANNKGKGYAIRYGLKDARADYFIYTDVDFPYTLESMLSVYNDLLNNADIVAGIRQTDYYEKLPAKRVFISKLVKYLIKHLLHTEITDTQCGLKGFNNRGRQVFLQTTLNGFLFDMEFIKLASANKNLILKPRIVCPKHDISFSHMNYKILIRETFNFIRLIFFR